MKTSSNVERSDVKRWTCVTLELESPQAPLPPALELAHRVSRLLGLELSGQASHDFQPQGSSAVAFGPLGRWALHTWPEVNMATLDVWTPSARWALLNEAGIQTLAQVHGFRILTLRVHEQG